MLAGLGTLGGLLPLLGRTGHFGPDSILSPDQKDGRAKWKKRFCETSCLLFVQEITCHVIRHDRSHDTVASATGEQHPCGGLSNAPQPRPGCVRKLLQLEH